MRANKLLSKVEENNSVSVRLPHTDGQGATNYKGSAKPANTKDCVLIIDWETGELRLERVSNQVGGVKTFTVALLHSPPC